MSRKISIRERWWLVRFVLSREWVLIAIGVLTMGISLSSLLSNSFRERVLGIVLAILMFLALALFVRIRLERDLKAGVVAETEMHLEQKRVEHREASTHYLVVDDVGTEYEVLPSWYRRLAAGERYHLHYIPVSRIILSFERPQSDAPLSTR